MCLCHDHTYPSGNRHKKSKEEERHPFLRAGILIGGLPDVFHIRDNHHIVLQVPDPIPWADQAIPDNSHIGFRNSAWHSQPKGFCKICAWQGRKRDAHQVPRQGQEAHRQGDWPCGSIFRRGCRDAFPHTLHSRPLPDPRRATVPLGDNQCGALAAFLQLDIYPANGDHNSHCLPGPFLSGQGLGLAGAQCALPSSHRRLAPPCSRALHAPPGDNLAEKAYYYKVVTKRNIFKNVFFLTSSMKTTYVNHLLKNVLNYVEGEKIALIFDRTFEKSVSEITTFLHGVAIPFSTYQYEHRYGLALPDNIREVFLGDENQILILGVYHNIWHSPERKEAKREKGKRLVNLIHPTGFCQSGLTDIDWLEAIATEVSLCVKRWDYVHVTSRSGTDLTALVDNTFCESGNYGWCGSGGDYPSGEVGFAPVLGSVNGIIVFDNKIQHVGNCKNFNHVVRVVNDEMTIIRGSQDYRDLIGHHKSLRYISEISIGVNPAFVESEDKQSIIEEKNLGTMHFGCGGNLSYGKREGPHFDSVILCPSLVINDQIVIENGRFNKKFLNLDRYVACNDHHE
jgi:hypothetical protein